MFCCCLCCDDAWPRGNFICLAQQLNPNSEAAGITPASGVTGRALASRIRRLAANRSADNWKGGIDFAADGEATEATLRANQPFVVAPVKTQSAEAAFEIVLAQAGCSLSRDSVDRRLIEEIRTGTAKFGETYKGGGKGIIDSQKAVGGWPELRSRPAPTDTDHDGLPDDWEQAQHLDPDNAADGALDANHDGYTHLEEYLNSLLPQS